MKHSINPKALPKILVIDDVYSQKGTEERQNFCINCGLKDPGISVKIEDPIAEVSFCSGQREVDGKTINDLESTLSFIRKGWERAPRWALLLLDLHFITDDEDERNPQNYFGLKILRELNKAPGLKDIPVIVFSANERELVEMEFSNHGALGFVEKNGINKDKINNLLFSHGLIEAQELLGQSTAFLKSLRKARGRTIIGNSNILLQGESGTGKELIAEYIHRQSGREGQFIPLFTQGVPETLIDDRLFGHQKGAFDGAKEDQAGAAELANKGTLFIDEFGNIPATIQEKLLRLLDKNTRQIQRIGSQEVKKLDLLIVLATNEMNILDNKNFRSDLLSRANARDAVVLPSLKKRKEDILLLADFFIKKFQKAFNAEERLLTDGAKNKLLTYDWPENIRELENVIESAVYRYKDLRVLSESHLPITIATKQGEELSIPLSNTKAPLKDVDSTHVADYSPLDLSSLLDRMEKFDFSPLRKEDLKGRLPQIQDTYARFFARYFLAALRETLKFNRQTSEDEIAYSKAAFLMKGHSQKGATTDKQLLLRFLKQSPNAIKELVKAEPYLEKAIRKFNDKKLNMELNLPEHQ